MPVILSVLFAASGTTFADAETDFAFDSPDVKAIVDEYFSRQGPKPGEAASDFELLRARGGKVVASDLWKAMPLVVTTGSYTCPIFRHSVPAREKLIKEFEGRVNFVIVYVIEAHPADGTCPYAVFDTREPVSQNDELQLSINRAYTLAERVRNARECRVALKLSGTVAVDTLDNATWKAYGSAPNCGYLIDTNGKVVAKQGLFDGDAMRAEIEKLLEKK